MITLFKLILQINSVISPFLEDIMGILPKNENENLINQTHIEEYTLPLPEPLPEPVTNSPTDNKDTLIMIGKGVIIVVGVTLIIYLIYKFGFSGDGAAPAAPAATHGIAPLVPLAPTNIVSTCLIIPGTLNPLPLSNLTTFALNYPYIVGLLPSNPLNPLFSAKLAFAATVLADNAAPIIGHIVTPLLDVAANELAITPVFDPIPPVSDPIPPVSDPIPSLFTASEEKTIDSLKQMLHRFHYSKFLHPDIKREMYFTMTGLNERHYGLLLEAAHRLGIPCPVIR